LVHPCGQQPLDVAVDYSRGLRGVVVDNLFQTPKGVLAKALNDSPPGTLR
jgi:hypothetical protein